MTLLERLGFSAPGPNMNGRPNTSHIRQASTGPAIVGRYDVGSGLALLRRDELTQGQFRAAYKDVVARLMRFRARNFAPPLLRCVVERRQDVQDEWEPVEPEHPWVHLWQRPNDLVHMNTLDFFKWIVMNLDGAGHADLLVIYDEVTPGVEVPMQLLPFFPEFGYVRPSFDEDSNVSSWTYYRADGEPIEDISPSQIIRIKNLHPSAPWRTDGLVEGAAYQVDQNLAANVYGRDSLQRQGLPDVMLELEGRKERQDVQQIGADFASTYSTGRQRGVPVSHSGAKIKELQLSKSDEQFQEQREFVYDVLHNLFEEHRGLFSENATEANAKAAMRVFAENVMQPTIDHIAAAFEHAFEYVFGVEEPGRIRIATPNVVPENRIEQEEVNAKRVQRGVPPAQIMREAGEEVPDDPALEESYLPGVLLPTSASRM